MSNKVKSNPVVQALVALFIAGTLSAIALGSGEDETDETETRGQEKQQQQQPPEYYTSNEELKQVSGHLSRVEAANKNLNSRIDNLEQILERVLTVDDLPKLNLNSENGDAAEIDVEDVTNIIVSKVELELSKKFNNGINNGINNGLVSSTDVGSVDEEIPDYGFDELLADGSEGNVSQWVYPLGYQEGNELSDFVGNLSDIGIDNNSLLSTANDGNQKKNKEKSKFIPYGTIHADSAIFGATSLNALIGRIEKKGINTDPFEFTAILSGDTLMANGFNFPQIKNAMISGVATGDMAFQCVRGAVTNITFIFNDGTIFQSQGEPKKPIARLADQWGNPCIKGVMVDDIMKHVGVQSALSGAASFSKLVAQQQQTLISNGAGDQSLALTGSTGKFAAGAIGGGALDKTVEIVGEQYDSYYRAVYVAPGEKITLLFKTNINIDYNRAGRKVSYENFNSKFNLASGYY